MHIKLLLSVLTLSLFSCTQAQQPTGNILCDKALEQYLGGNDSLPTVPLHYATFSDSLSTYMAQYVGNTTNAVWYRVQIVPDSNFNPLNIKVYYANPMQPPEMRKRDVIELRLNSMGQLLFEGELIPQDSLHTTLHSYLVNSFNNKEGYADLKNSMVTFLWDKGVNETYFNDALWAIVTAHLDFVEYLSTSKYQKNFCQLSHTQKEEVLKNTTFKLSLGNGNTRAAIPHPDLPMMGY